jgi:WG containing repeat
MKAFIITCSILFSHNLFGQNLIRFYENAKVGFKNENNEIVVKPIYAAGSEFENGIALVVYNNKRGYIDGSGKEIISLLYDDATMFSEEGLAAVKFAGKYGYINKKGEWIIQPIFENGYIFTEGLARVMKNGKYGFINTAGEIVIPCVYEFANDFSEGLATVRQNNKCGFLNAIGQKVIDFNYAMATSFKNGQAIVRKNENQNYYINKQGVKLKDLPKIEEEKERDDRNEMVEKENKIIQDKK